jgi:hypothetical protein
MTVSNVESSNLHKVAMGSGRSEAFATHMVTACHREEESVSRRVDVSADELVVLVNHVDS